MINDLFINIKEPSALLQLSMAKQNDVIVGLQQFLWVGVYMKTFMYICIIMSKDEDLLKNLRQMIEEQGIESFHLLEDLVPIEEQMEFFRESDKQRRLDDTFDTDEEIVILFSSNQPLTRKKKSLLKLSSIPDVKAYRAIETYHSSPLEPELLNWSSMALVGSRIILSSNLSGQQQVYISSGLGGQGKKLRFFGLFNSATFEPFTELQREIIEREFKFQFSQQDIGIESFDIRENYFAILMLFPIEIDARISINLVLEEINKFGGFLDTKFLFTNVRILNDIEVGQFLEKKKNMDSRSAD